MTRMRATAPSGKVPGLATRCISPNPATPMPPCDCQCRDHGGDDAGRQHAHGHSQVPGSHKSLEARDLLPAEHLVDKGYTDAGVLIDSQRDYAVAVIGPVADDPSWQARADAGFDKSHFAVDWDRQRVTCPAGKQSISWLPKTNPKSVILVEARFSGRDCTPCPLRSCCTRSKHEPRIIRLQAREYHEALQAARKRQDTAEFRESYAARAGIEATHGQAVRRCGLRRCRYIGLARTHLQHLISAAAINLVRIANWVNGIPTAQTRCSWFAALQKAA